MYQHIDLAEQDTYDTFCWIDFFQYYFIFCILSFIIMSKRFKFVREDLKFYAFSTILDVPEITKFI